MGLGLVALSILNLIASTQVVVLNKDFSNYAGEPFPCVVGESPPTSMINTGLLPGCVNGLSFSKSAYTSVNVKCINDVPTFEYFRSNNICDGSPDKITTVTTCAKVDLVGSGIPKLQYAACVQASDFIVQSVCYSDSQPNLYTKTTTIKLFKLNSCNNGLKWVLGQSQVVQTTCDQSRNISSAPLNLCHVFVLEDSHATTNERLFPFVAMIWIIISIVL